MKWLTWENVGVDRMACAWVIRKWIDANAEFEFIPEGSSIPERSGASDAEAFDIPGVRLSHHHGHSSVHTVILEYKLTDPVLMRIARIVDEADEIVEVALEPVASGLDFICRGIRRTSPNDSIAFERGALIFDALYAELTHELGTEGENA
jgi:hypothetical protein